MSIVRSTEYRFCERDFATIVEIVREEAGIVLGQQKRDLVYGRLAKRLRTIGLADFGDYCALLTSDAGAQERRHMVNAITTNLTGFFREAHHFDHLGKNLRAAVEPRDGTGRLRLWSAGCSSGEEAYSMAMTVRDLMRATDKWDVKILATDIDTEMVARAKAGRYDPERISTVPLEKRRRYTRQAEDGRVQMTDDIRSLIVFNPLNLFHSWPMRGLFQAIFCRNVVIYFSRDDQRILFDRFANSLVPGGWLFIGHSETLHNVSDRFRHIGTTIYQKVT